MSENNKDEFKFKNTSKVKKEEKTSNFSFFKYLFIYIVFLFITLVLYGVKVKFFDNFNPIRDMLKGGKSPNNIENCKKTCEKTENTTAQGTIPFSDFNNTVIEIAKNATPSVVGITIEYDVASFLGKSTGSAKGSGIILSDDGYILTNNHVVNPKLSSSFYDISQASKITVTFSKNENEKFEAKIIGKDELTDLAVIKVEKHNLPKATLGDSDKLQIGEFLMAIGNPLGFNHSVTTGVVSGLNRKLSTNNSSFNAIQTNAAVNAGNSGGPIVNIKGEVVGITTLKAGGNNVDGLSFAIPINQAKKIAQDLIKDKKVNRPELGIAGFEITPDLEKQLNLPKGILIKEVKKGSAAEKAGILPLDVITKINGENISSFSEITMIQTNLKPNDKLKITVFRSGKEKDLELIIQ